MLPLIEELPYYISACDSFPVVAERKMPLLLDSAMQHKEIGRYSLLACDPFLVFCCRGKKIDIIERDMHRKTEADPWKELERLVEKYQTSNNTGLPLGCGGAIGYLGYDMGRFLEKVPALNRGEREIPDCYVGFYDTVLIQDLFSEKTYLVSTGLPERDHKKAQKRARQRLQLFKELLKKGRTAKNKKHEVKNIRNKKGWYGATSNFTREEYCCTISRVQRYIRAGDIYQANISQRIEAPLLIQPYELYLRLRRLNPSPFAAYLQFPEVIVASASPERFLYVNGRQVETRPIKGTRPRGNSVQEDRKIASELIKSPKDKAELTMIVDLERNDLGRVCRPGTVRVPQLFNLESYATVHHLVAKVTGELLPDKSRFDLLRASFPGGSITGAPKVRAMEIIEEVEPVRRGIYTGTIFHMGFDDCMDSSIVIRTFIIKNKENKVYFQVGGGIVADSEPEAEYIETIDKARALFKALGLKESGLI